MHCIGGLKLHEVLAIVITHKWEKRWHFPKDRNVYCLDWVQDLTGKKKKTKKMLLIVTLSFYFLEKDYNQTCMCKVEIMENLIIEF